MRNDIVNNNAWCKHIVPTYMWLYVSKRNIKNKNSFFRQLAYTHAVTLLLECPWDHLPSRGTLSDEFSTADCSNSLTGKCEIFMDLTDFVLNSLANSVSSSILFILSAGILTTALVQRINTLCVHQIGTAFEQTSSLFTQFLLFYHIFPQVSCCIRKNCQLLRAKSGNCKTAQLVH